MLQKYFSKDYWVEWVFLPLILAVTFLGFFQPAIGEPIRPALIMLFAALAEGKVARAGILKYFSLLVVLIFLGGIIGAAFYFASPLKKTSGDIMYLQLGWMMQAFVWSTLAIEGLLLQKALSFILGKFRFSGLMTHMTVYFTLVVLVLSWSAFKMKNNVAARNLQLQEFGRRDRLFEELSLAIGAGRLPQVNTEAFIAVRVPGNDYEVKEGALFHSYGDKIFLSQSNDVVSVKYVGIPAGDDCFEAYNMNQPNGWGFRKTLVDGEIVPVETVSMDQKKEHFCGNGKKTVIVEYQGALADIREAAAVRNTAKNTTGPANSLPELPQSPEIAEKVAEQFTKMPFPGSAASDFEHWAYDTSAMSANHCWSALNKNNPKPAVLKNFSPTRSGSWTLPDDSGLVKACRSFADTGFKPDCFRAQVVVKNVKIRPGLPSDYLQVHSKDQALELEGSLHCYLNSDQLEVQEYWGPLQAKWIEPPSAKTINLPSGPETLQAGTIMVSAPGVKNAAGNDFEEPHRALVVPAP